MEGNWDNVFAMEQVWVLRDILDAVKGQLSSCRPAGLQAEESVLLPTSSSSLQAHQDVSRNRDPGVLIQEKSASLKTSILKKMSLLFRYRLGHTLDFATSVINGFAQDDNECSDKLRDDRAALRDMAVHARKLRLPTSLDQYTYLVMLMFGLLKYLHDLEYTRRVSKGFMDLLPHQNRLRYIFHRYETQFMFASRYDPMKRYNNLRKLGWQFVDGIFDSVNENSDMFVAANSNSNTRHTPDKLYHECLARHRRELEHYLNVFGVQMVPVQSTSRDAGSGLLPEEDPSNWVNIPSSSVRTAAEGGGLRLSENSMFLSGHDPGDEVQYSQGDDGLLPQSSGAHSERTSSDESDLEGDIGAFRDFLNDPGNYTWMFEDEPDPNRTRREN